MSTKKRYPRCLWTGATSFYLATLSPGVALPSVAVAPVLLPRINGSRPRTNEYIYDGISVLQPEPGQVVYYPIIDGMEEFKLNVNAYSPEYGRSNGGTVMVVGKSGSNQFHGSAFEFFRNEALNARNLFAPTGPKPEFRRNQYGLTARRPNPKQQTVLLRGLAGDAAAHWHHAVKRGSDVGTAARDFHPADLRSCDFAAHGVSRQCDSFGAFRRARSPGPSALPVTESYWREQLRREPPPSPTIRIKPTSGLTVTSGRNIESLDDTLCSSTTTRRSLHSRMEAEA